MSISLYKIDKTLKQFLTAYLLVVTVGLSIGLYFVNHTTSLTPDGAVERFRGSETGDEFEIPENYPKPVSEMLVTTHNHILGFSFIFGSVGLIFYFNRRVKGILKKILLIEPFISIILSFGSLWLMRYFHHSFVYVTIISAILLYISFYIMIVISIYDMWKKE